MANQTMSVSKLDQLPEAARDRIEQLRLLFIERSKGHLVQIQELASKRQFASETQAADADLMKLAHSLVGTSGIFGFQALGEAAFKLENTVRENGYSEADFTEAMAGLIEQLNALA
ncbi:MAG: Hpt domain-containing protein [Hoeflea sp.]|uniref:Hpt domain-containing protein n=1 Tax=Hoeflea sp. TaxID=1940281 RepID=UPI003EF834A1